MKVLASAYACAPGQGSEPGLGWGWVRRISREHDVWVLTAEAHRQEIEREQRRAPNPRARFHFVDLPPALAWLAGRGRLRYYLWQLAAWRLAKRLHREVGFDCGQHCSYGMYWMPSFLALMPFPYVWGPVGGGETTPSAFWFDLPFRGKVYEALRLAAQRIGERDPWVRATARRAALTLAATSHTQARVRGMGSGRTRVCHQFYITAEDIHRLARTPMRREKTLPGDHDGDSHPLEGLRHPRYTPSPGWRRDIPTASTGSWATVPTGGASSGWRGDSGSPTG